MITVALMSALSANGNAVASRILGDLLRVGSAGTVDLPGAEAAYRLAVTQGDKTSEQRVAQILAMTERFPEAIAAYKALIDEVPAAEPRYLCTIHQFRSVIPDAPVAALRPYNAIQAERWLSDPNS